MSERTNAAAYDFGQLSDGQTVRGVVLERDGIRADLISFGARLHGLHVPDRVGTMADVVLGFDDIRSYETLPNCFGATIGRFANRIAGAHFALDGELFEVEANEGPNCLHGGSDGFADRNWTLVDTGTDPHPQAVFALTSPHRDAGFPGRLAVRAIFELAHAGELAITYEAQTDRPTVVNLTNHAYFNLSGLPARDALDHRLTVSANTFLPIDEQSIPLAHERDVSKTAFDFRQPKALGAGVRDGDDPQILAGAGYDHCFRLNTTGSDDPGWAARLEDETSGRLLDLWTTAPGLQVYTANDLDGSQRGKGGRTLRQSDAVCLEPQAFPDSPNRPDFPSSRLDPGETFRAVSRYRFSHR